MSDEKTEETDGINKKDVTLDFLIDDDPGDLQGDHLDNGGSASVEDRGDHPAVAILDMAIKQSGEYLRKEGLPPANSAVYEGFSRPFLNTALWHYLPDGSIPDDPRVALLLGVGGLGIAFAPTLLALNRRKDEEEKRRKEAKARKEEKEEDDPDRPDRRDRPTPSVRSSAPPEESAGPERLARLGETAAGGGGGLPGM